MSEAAFRRAVIEAMDARGSALTAAIQDALSRVVGSEAAQIELDPWSQRVTLCSLEEDLLPDDWAELPDWPDEGDEILSELLFPWLASCWAAAGGGPAFAFWHGFEARFDLVQRRWLQRLD
ncbi:MAG: hypothetical protein Q8L48_21360 [Archangium sp.]|nr:hypothetical protein [Archangium sp.]